MIYKAKKYKIEISESVINILTKYKQEKETIHESGGILLGQVKNKYILVSKATMPHIYDSSTRNSFIRDQKTAQIIVDYEFYNSYGHLIYLGEWHTHPEDHPSPSIQDHKMIKKQFENNILNVNYILMFIIGNKSNYIEIYDGSDNFKAKLIDI